jgi:F-type H+-transporting ATPase subunit gamma
VEVVSTVYYSSASQKAEISVMLPVGAEADRQKHEEHSGEAEKKAAAAGDMIFDPAPDVILKNLIPHMIKANLYRLFLEAAAAEWIYRRVAMKSATDAASEMQKMLNRTYNRIRQASITQEIGEIVAGADSVK